MTSPAAKASVRLVAVQLLHRLENHKGSLTTLLPEAEARVSVSDRALLRELCFGVARWSVKLSALISLLTAKPLRRKDRDVHWLLQLGLYQLDSMRIADHAALDTTVSVARELRKPWARGLVNAVLRQYLRQRDHLENQLDESARYATPTWLTAQLKVDWPQQWQQHLEGSNERPPMTLRVNRLNTSSDEYQRQLQDQGLGASVSDVAPGAIVLQQPVAVEQLPAFAQGAVSVQDASAQWAAPILQPATGERILDACAAPGGKTGHLLELNKDISVVAVDVIDERLQRVTQNLMRLQLDARAETLCADVTELEWWDRVSFDAVLLDAPCSGTGVIRRHPDIKLLRRREDIDTLVELQAQMLRTLWQVVRPGGRLLYATCSVLKAENENQIRRFLTDQSDARLLPVAPIPHALDTGFGQQLLRGSHDGDGFFYALLGRSNESSP